jgi:hypothetical protein
MANSCGGQSEGQDREELQAGRGGTAIKVVETNPASNDIPLKNEESIL